MKSARFGAARTSRSSLTGDYDDLHGLIDTLYAELLARDLELGEGPVLINYLDDADEVVPPHQRAHVYLPLALD